MAPGPSQTGVVSRRLLDLGWEDGRNLRIERHSAEGRLERAEAIFAELATRGVDIIFTTGNLGAHVMAALAKRATRSIPIVFNGGGFDPVGQGLVASLARPGGNVTGFSISLGPEFALKRLELFNRSCPGIKRVASLGPRAISRKSSCTCTTDSASWDSACSWSQWKGERLRRGIRDRRA